MGQKTQPFKRSLSGSIGAGVKSVIGGDGRRYFVLEHKVSSKYYKAGEEQQIIVDQVEIGRDPNCAVRLEGKNPDDKMFQIVSRKHAAIQKEEDNWVLVHLSTTNSTFLNGRRMSTPGQKWYLQNGDEIQIAESGPKMGFKIPQGKKGLVSSIGLTARMSLFRKQALRPYKKAITALGCLLVLLSLGGGYVIYEQSKKINEQAQLIAKGEQQITEIIEINKQNEGKITELIKQTKDLRETASTAVKKAADAERRAALAEEKVRKPIHDVNLTPYHKDVYFIKCHKVTINGESFIDVGSDNWFTCGTGFMLCDGKFVTARHVSDPLYYSNDYGFNAKGELVVSPNADLDFVGTWMKLNNMANNGFDVVFHYKAVSPTSSFDFTSKDFVCDRSKDMMYTVEGDIKFTEKTTLGAGSMIRVGSTGRYDWAYIPMSQKTGLKAAYSESKSLAQGTRLFILGYPSGRGEGNPILSEAKCAQNGLDTDGTIMASNNNTEGGNSGGPVFIVNGEEASVVGIVSGRTYEKGRFVPINVINR